MDLKAIHEHMIRAELQRREHGDGPGVLAAIRALATRLFSARDRQIAPAPDPDVLPAVPIILHDGRHRLGELDIVKEPRQAA
jgi:hypothetical protein